MRLTATLSLARDSMFDASSLPLSHAALQEYREPLQWVVTAHEPFAPYIYMSLLDAVAAVLVPGLQADVLAYYADEGPRLGELVDDAELRALDHWLAAAIDLCADIVEANSGEGRVALRDWVRRFIYLR